MQKLLLPIGSLRVRPPQQPGEVHRVTYQYEEHDPGDLWTQRRYAYDLTLIEAVNGYLLHVMIGPAKSDQAMQRLSPRKWEQRIPDFGRIRYLLGPHETQMYDSRIDRFLYRVHANPDTRNNFQPLGAWELLPALHVEDYLFRAQRRLPPPAEQRPKLDDLIRWIARPDGPQAYWSGSLAPREKAAADWRYQGYQPPRRCKD